MRKCKSAQKQLKNAVAQCHQQETWQRRTKIHLSGPQASAGIEVALRCLPPWRPVRMRVLKGRNNHPFIAVVVFFFPSSSSFSFDRYVGYQAIVRCCTVCNFKFMKTSASRGKWLLLSFLTTKQPATPFLVALATQRNATLTQLNRASEHARYPVP